MTTPPCFMDDPDKRIGAHETLFILANAYPIGPIHLLLVPEEHREELDEKDIASARAFSIAFPQYLVFHNMRGSGATRPEHVHLHALLRDESLPLETACRRELFSLEGAMVARVDYPAYALAVTGARAAEIVYAVLSAFAPAPFNLVMTRGEILVIPRSQEIPSGFSSRFGGLEVTGAIVLTDNARYESLTCSEICEALAECGLPPDERDAFEWSVLRALVRAELDNQGGPGVRLAPISKGEAVAQADHHGTADVSR